MFTLRDLENNTCPLLIIRDGFTVDYDESYIPTREVWFDGKYICELTFNPEDTLTAAEDLELRNLLADWEANQIQV